MSPETACANCGQPAEADFEHPLCYSCRSLLACRPFPGWIKLGFLIVLIALVASLIKFPRALEAGVAFERGRKAEARGDHAQAASHYSEALAEFPGSTKILIRLGIVYLRKGDMAQGVEVLDRLEGKHLSREQAQEIDQAIKAIKAKPRLVEPERKN